MFMLRKKRGETKLLAFICRIPPRRFRRFCISMYFPRHVDLYCFFFLLNFPFSRRASSQFYERISEVARRNVIFICRYTVKMGVYAMCTALSERVAPLQRFNFLKSIGFMLLLYFISCEYGRWSINGYCNRSWKCHYWFTLFHLCPEFNTVYFLHSFYCIFIRLACYMETGQDDPSPHWKTNFKIETVRRRFILSPLGSEVFMQALSLKGLHYW